MAIATPNSNLGRRLFAIATLGSGLITLIWHDEHSAHPLRYIAYAAAASLIFGGAALHFPRLAKAGAATLVSAYLVLCLRCIPGIIAAPRIYNSWGNFFEQFSLWTGAALVYARLSAWSSLESLQRIGRILFGLCAASFALEQAVYLSATASLVPKWVPPNPMFWAVATTIFFALAALALLTNYLTLLASRLLTLMIFAFGLLVWLPLLASAPHSHTNWSETAETFAIAGAIWILAELLAEHRPQRGV